MPYFSDILYEFDCTVCTVQNRSDIFPGNLSQFPLALKDALKGTHKIARVQRLLGIAELIKMLYTSKINMMSPATRFCDGSHKIV